MSGPFKTFMDATGRLWKTHGLPSGDKQSTLLSMFVFAMQHGMFWVGNAIDHPPSMCAQRGRDGGERAAVRIVREARVSHRV